MTAVEIFVTFGAGYVSGLSIASGFIFQAIRKFNRTGWTKGREALWATAALANIVLGSLMPIFLMALIVFDKAEFWPRMSLFACGAAAGGALVFFGVHINSTKASGHWWPRVPNNSFKPNLLRKSA